MEKGTKDRVKHRLPVRVWHGWSMRRVVAAVVLGLAAVAVCHRAWLDMWSIALRDEQNTHILLAPLVVIWLVIVRRERIRKCRPQGEWMGTLILFAGAVVSGFGLEHGHQLMWHGGAVLALVGAVFTALGSMVFARFLPAVVAIAFVIPVPGQVLAAISIPLQAATAEATYVALDLLGVAASRSGNMIEVDGVAVYIAEGSDGLRMIFALVLVAYAFAFGTPLRPGVRGLIVALSPLAADVFNLLRLIPTVLLYAHADRGIAGAFDRVGGWLMVVIAFLVLLSVLRMLRWAKVPLTRYALAYD